MEERLVQQIWDESRTSKRRQELTFTSMVVFSSCRKKKKVEREHKEGDKL